MARRKKNTIYLQEPGPVESRINLICAAQMPKPHLFSHLPVGGVHVDHHPRISAADREDLLDSLAFDER